MPGGQLWDKDASYRSPSLNSPKFSYIILSLNVSDSMTREKRGTLRSFGACSLARLRFGKAKRRLSLWQCEGGNDLNYMEGAWKVRAGLKDGVLKTGMKRRVKEISWARGAEIGMRRKEIERFTAKNLGLGLGEVGLYSLLNRGVRPEKM